MEGNKEINDKETAESILRWVRPSIRKLVPYSSARDEFSSNGEQMVFLDANENPYENGVNRYPDPYHRSLRERLSEIKGIQIDRLTTGNGSDELIDLLLRIFCRPGLDKVLLCPPTYGMYRVWADINETEVKEVPLKSDFRLDLPALLEAIKEPEIKMIFLCSPNNPTANTLDEEEVHILLERFGRPVVIDEAYIDFSSQSSWSNKLDKYPNLVVLQTLSKARGMAGLRLGYSFAHPVITRLLHSIKPPYNVSTPNQRLALKLLADQEDYTLQLEILILERERLTVELRKLSWVKEVFPSEANFLLFRVDDADRRYQQLLERGVVVRNRSRLIHCHACLRASVGTPEENIKFIETAKQLTA